jgi:hypothetical protein
MKCGEPYTPQHRCPKLVDLHVVEEMMELLQQQGTPDSNSDLESQESDIELLSLSAYATEGTQGKKTIRLHGLLKKQEILILVDSGSSATFISNSVVTALHLPTTPILEATVKQADGSLLQCNNMVLGLTWWVQGISFTIDAKVLP